MKIVSFSEKLNKTSVEYKKRSWRRERERLFFITSGRREDEEKKKRESGSRFLF